jgi:hypothetical protein
MSTELDDEDVVSEEETRDSDAEDTPAPKDRIGKASGDGAMLKPSTASVQEFLRSSETTESSVVQMEVSPECSRYLMM